MKMKMFFLAGIVLLFSSFQPAGKSPFAGKWKETWAYGEESDVTYQDEYEVSGKKKKVRISCTTHPKYEFRKIKTAGRRISFSLINAEHELPYELTMEPGNLTMKGKATGITGKTVSILWEKMP